MFIFVPASSLQSSHNQYTTPHSQFRQAWAQLLEAAPRHAIKPWFLRQKVSSPKMQWFKIWKDTETMVFPIQNECHGHEVEDSWGVCCNMLQYVAICCNMLQYGYMVSTGYIFGPGVARKLHKRHQPSRCGRRGTWGVTVPSSMVICTDLHSISVRPCPFCPC